METKELLSEIRETKREVIETRNLNIKADNNMRSLFAELKKVSGNQKQAERKARISSIAAYLLFVAIIAIGAFYISGIRASSLQAKMDGLNDRIQRLEGEVRVHKRDLATRDAAEKSAIFLLKLIREEKKEEAVAEFRKVQTSGLSKVELELLKEKVDQFASDMAVKYYENGVSHWCIGGYKSAIQEFKTSLDYMKEMDHKGALLYHYGHSLLQLQKHEEGMEILKSAIAADPGKNLADKARINISDTYMKIKRWEDAINYMESLPMEQLGYWSKVAILNKIKFAKQMAAKAAEDRKKQQEKQ